MKKIYLLIILYLFNQNSFALDNLGNEDYIGVWESDWTAMKEEKQILIFTSSNEVSFKRVFKDNNEQYFETKNVKNIDDIVLLKFLDASGNLVYKLVLSGWKIETKMKIYGTMFMYKHNVQFNGIPISFVKVTNSK